MKINKNISAAWLIWVAVCQFSTPATAEQLRLGFLPEEPAPSIAEALSEILTEHELTLIPFATALELEQELLEDGIDLAIMEEPENTIVGLQWVAALYPSLLHMLSGIPAPQPALPQLLNTGPVYVGPEGGIADRLAKSLRKEYGLSGDGPLHNNPFSPGQQSYFIFGGLLSDDAVSRLDDYQLIGLSGLDQWQRGSLAEAITFRHPNLHPILIPADLYPALSHQPVISVAVTTLLVSSKGVSAETAYEISESIDQNFARIGNLYPLARSLTNESSSTQEQTRTLPAHPGTIRYQQREAPNLLERYAEVMALVVTLLIASLSGLVALSRIRRQRRKDRLDNYFEQALVLSEQARSAAKPDAADGFQRQIQALRAEVIGLFVNEKIEADTTFLAFLMVSEQLSDALPKSSNSD